MDGQLNFELRLSLEETVLRRVVVNLWGGADPLASIESLRFELLPDDVDEWGFYPHIEREVSKSDRWRETIESVKARVRELRLPESLKSRMMQVVRPIGSEALRWRLLFHEAHLSDSRQESFLHLQQLCWTPAAKVDCKRTAERLVRLQTTDVVKRYQLACWYCLEKDIPVLWQELPEECKSSISRRLDLSPFTTTPLDDYWAQILELEGFLAYENPLTISESYFHRCAFETSATRGNKAAAEYFLQKLADGHRNWVLDRAAGRVLHVASGIDVRGSFPKEMFSDLFFYLWSQMTPEGKAKVFRSESYAHIFGFLMDWPWQDLLLDSADVVHSLSERGCSQVVTSINRRIGDGFCFPKLLQDFFYRCPGGFRKCFLISLLTSIFTGHTVDPDVDAVKEIFRHVDFGPGQLASSSPFTQLLVRLIMRDQWDVVEVCLQEALRSTKYTEGLRENFKRNSADSEGIGVLRGTGRVKRFYELLEKMEASANICKDPDY